MDDLGRKLRASIGASLVWPLVWLAAAAIGFIVIAGLNPASIDKGEGYWDVAPFVALAAFACGAAFCVLLSAFEKRVALWEVTFARAAVIGFLIGAAFPLVMQKDFGMSAIIGPLGALSAIASIGFLRMNRRTLNGSRFHPENGAA